MTLTLRIYDEDEIELAWVTVDPYDYEITHPDGTETRKNSHLKYLLNVFEVPEERGHAFVGGFQTQTVNFPDLSDEEHFDYIIDGISKNPETSVASTELVNE